MKTNFIPVDYDYFDWKGRNYIKLIGRNDKGKRVCVIDSFEPYFYAILKGKTSEKKIQKIMKKINKIEIKSSSRTTKIEKVQLQEKNYLGKKVKALKIFITNYKDAHPVADKIGMKEIEARREYDLKLITKYITEKEIVPLSWYSVEGKLLNGN